MVDYYWNEDHSEFMVLVSTGFGAGFSTWAYEYPEIAYDKNVVELYLEYGNHIDASIIHTRLEELGYHNVYLGGWEDIVTQWVPVNTYWRITEYDGAEGIEYFDPAAWNYIKKETENE